MAATSTSSQSPASHSPARRRAGLIVLAALLASGCSQSLFGAQQPPATVTTITPPPPPPAVQTQPMQPLQPAQTVIVQPAQPAVAPPPPVLAQPLPPAAPAFTQAVPAAPAGTAPFTPPVGAAQGPSAVARTHTVVPGDNVFRLSQFYGVSRQAIQAANGLDADFKIRVGQDLIIPAQGGAIAAAPAPAAAPTAAAMSTATAGRPMARPVQGRITRPFRSTEGGAESNGVGIAAPIGSPVFAADAGTVAFVSPPSSAVGSVVLVEHPGGMITVYGRVDGVRVQPGQAVGRGQQIAQVAQSSDGEPRLHFELRNGADPLDPTPYI